MSATGCSEEESRQLVESDEDEVTSYLPEDPLLLSDVNSLNSLATSKALRAEHILEDNLQQLAQIHESIQQMRRTNLLAQNLNSDESFRSSLFSASCPSLDKHLHDNHVGGKSQRAENDGAKAGRQNRASGTINSRRDKSVASATASSGSDDDLLGSNGAAHRHVHSRHSSRKHGNAPPSQLQRGRRLSPRPPLISSGGADVSRRRHGGREKGDGDLMRRAMSTPSIPQQKGSRLMNLPEPTHVYLQKLISEHDWCLSSSESNSEDEGEKSNNEKRSESQVIRNQEQQQQQRRYESKRPTLTSAEHNNNHGSPQLSLVEFLKDGNPQPDTIDGAAHSGESKNRRKKERSSIFFRKKSKKPPLPPPLLKAPSAMNLLSNTSSVENGNRPLGQSHSYSMSSLRRGSLAVVPSSQFYVARTTERSSRVNADEKDGLETEDTAGLLESEFLPCTEFSEEGGPALIRNLETDPLLKIQEEEPESWQQATPIEASLHLDSTQVKRQEHIYEFIVTESNHCQVLRVIQKIFVEGMLKYLSLSKSVVDKIFPSLELLIDIHFKFLEALRHRQMQSHVVSTISDLLLSQWNGAEAERWKIAYGTICSQHNAAVTLYKELLKSDRRFASFIRQCSNNPLLKKKGIPECLFFITTRITKYPLLIEAMIKTSKDLPKEQLHLQQASTYIKTILHEVNRKKAERENEERYLELYKNIDAKTSVMFRNRKLRKPDVLLTGSRRLMFEGSALLLQERRSLPVTVVVLSDIVFFLQESNQKLYFVTPENKAGVVSTRSLLVQDRVGGSSNRSILLISTHEDEDMCEVFELEITQPTKEDWLNGIRAAVDNCVSSSEDEGENESNELSRIDKRRRRHKMEKELEAKQVRTRQLVAEMRSKDLELARLLEERMQILGDIFRVMATSEERRRQLDQVVPLPDTYVNMVRQKDLDNHEAIRDQILTTLQEVSVHASVLHGSPLPTSSPCSGNVSRSVSFTAERNSENEVAALPKRSETFGGFDQQLSASLGTTAIATTTTTTTTTMMAPEVASVEREDAAVHLAHHINSLRCLVTEHFTTVESMTAEMKVMKEQTAAFGGRYKRNQQLEETKRLRRQMLEERRQYHMEREAREAELESKRLDLLKFQAEVERGLKDVKEQRDQLYRKLDLLRAQGIEVLGPHMAIMKTGDNGATHSSRHLSDLPSEVVESDKNIFSGSHTAPAAMSLSARLSSPVLGSQQQQRGSSNSVANPHLISATKETIVSERPPELKQQIPMKLSNKMSMPSTTTAYGANRRSSSSLKQNALSGSLSNLTKPLVEGGVQQLLPFKLASHTDANATTARQGSSPKGSKNRTSVDDPSDQPQHQRMGSSPSLHSLPRGGKPPSRHSGSHPTGRYNRGNEAARHQGNETEDNKVFDSFVSEVETSQ